MLSVRQDWGTQNFWFPSSKGLVWHDFGIPHFENPDLLINISMCMCIGIWCVICGGMLYVYGNAYMCDVSQPGLSTITLWMWVKKPQIWSTANINNPMKLRINF